MPTVNRVVSCLLPIAVLIASLGGCVDAPAPVSGQDDARASPPVHTFNLTQEETRPARASTPCVGFCLSYEGYYHKVADVEDMSLLRLDGVVEWEPPAALCEKLVVRVKIVSSTTDDLLYVTSGDSPLRFKLENLSIPMMRNDTFLRVVVGNERYSTPAGDYHANGEVPYRLHTTAWLRAYSAADTWPDAAGGPLGVGPTSHCGPQSPALHG